MPQTNERTRVTRGDHSEAKPHHPIDSPELSPEELAVAMNFTPAPRCFKIFDGLWLAFYVYCFIALATGPRIYRGTPQETHAFILIGICTFVFIVISLGQHFYAKRSGHPRMRHFEIYRALGCPIALLLLKSAVLPGRFE